jgi:DNA-binding transcriptional LysR family regulator
MVKPWADKLLDNDVKGATVAMLAEIDELRAELQTQKQLTEDMRSASLASSANSYRLGKELAALKQQEPLFERGEIGALNEVLSAEHPALYISPGALT